MAQSPVIDHAQLMSELVAWYESDWVAHREEYEKIIAGLHSAARSGQRYEMFDFKAWQPNADTLRYMLGPKFRCKYTVVTGSGENGNVTRVVRVTITF